jgi:hypothetical protein
MLKALLALLGVFFMATTADAQWKPNYRYNYNYSYYSGYKVPAYPYSWGPYGNYGYNPWVGNAGYYNYYYGRPNVNFPRYGYWSSYYNNPRFYFGFRW